MAKPKYIRTEDFNPVFAEQWKPVVFRGGAMAVFARAIPDEGREKRQLTLLRVVKHTSMQLGLA